MSQFTLPPLPYSNDALSPFLSAETLEIHHGKHHKTYVDKLNTLVKGTPFENSSLEEIVLKSTGPLFNNAAQVWNHTFYWNGLSPKGQSKPTGDLLVQINKAFGDLEGLKAKLSEAAINQFGSGWAWIVKDVSGALAVTNTANAGNPLTDKKKPLLTCDVWEHAYYIDYRNLRPKYFETFWQHINWEFVAQQLADR